MRMNRRMLIVSVIGTVLGLLILYSTANRIYFSPRAAILSDLEEATEDVTRYRSALENRVRLQRQLRDYINRTLGGDIETVDHRLRTRLSRIAEQIDLESISVTTGTARALGSPARSLFRGASLRDLRDEIDFVEVPGSITAEGSLAQAVELIDRIDAEPWLKQMHDVNLDPHENGRRVSVRVRVRTLFLPGHTPDETPQSPYDEDRLLRLASLLEGNPFHLPAPPEPSPEPSRRASTTLDRSFPFDQWVLTGVAEGRHGAEAWLRNRRSGESRRIEVGEGLEKLVLVATRGEFAEFERDDERFLIAVGSSLNDRTPLNR